MRVFLMSLALVSAAAAGAQQPAKQQQPSGVLNGAQMAQATLCTTGDGSIPAAQMTAACTSLLDTAPLNPMQRANILIARGITRVETEPAAARTDLDQGLASGNAAPESQAYALERRAYLRSGKEPALAITDYGTALKLLPNWAAPRLGHALLSLDLGRFDVAYEDADAGMKITGLGEDYYSEFLRIRGEAQAGRKNDAAALADLNEAVRRGPNNVAALTSRGRLHRSAGRYDAALADMDAAVRLAPKSAYEARAACWTRAAYAKRDYNRARALCETALTLEPGIATTFDSIGLVALQQKRWQDAFAAYDAALKIDTKSASARFGRGIAELRLGRTNDGNADIAGAVSAEPVIAQTYSGYGQQP